MKGVTYTSLQLLYHLVICRVKSRSRKERERQSAIQYKFYLQLCLALLGMYIVFLAGINRTHDFIGCVVASVLLHYLTLAAVLWMSAICSFLFWIMVVNPFAQANFKCCRMAVITFICWGESTCTLAYNYIPALHFLQLLAWNCTYGSR